MRCSCAVELADVNELPGRIAQRVSDGYLYGDGQFEIDPASDGFLRRCVFSTYRPAAPGVEISPGQKALAREDWQRLLLLTHVGKSAAFEIYSDYYLSTSGGRANRSHASC